MSAYGEYTILIRKEKLASNIPIRYIKIASEIKHMAW
jgi:hypothetical protein